MTTSEAIWYASAGLAACGALWLWYLAMFRDTSRRAARRAGREGRLPRCPKCAYDLSGAMGQDAAPPTCPECGRRAKRARTLYRTRRHTRLASAAMLLTLGAPAALAMPSIQGNRPYRLVPTWVLVWAYQPPRVNAGHSSQPLANIITQESAWEKELKLRSLTGPQMLRLLRHDFRFEDCFPSVWIRDQPVPIWAQHTNRINSLPWQLFTLTGAEEAWRADELSFTTLYNVGQRYLPFSDYRGQNVLRISTDGPAVIRASLRWPFPGPWTRTRVPSGQQEPPEPSLHLELPLDIHESVDDVLTPIDSESTRQAILDAITVIIGSDGRPKAEMSTPTVDGTCIASVQIDFLRADGRYLPIFLSADTRQWSPEQQFMRPDEDAPAQLMRVGLSQQEFTVTDLEGCFLYIRSEPLGALAIANWTGFKHKSYWKGSMVVPLSAVKVNQYQPARGPQPQ